MLAAMPILAAASTFNPLPACTLFQAGKYSEELSALPAEIGSDFQSRFGQIYPRSEKRVTFSDAPAPGEKIGNSTLVRSACAQ